MDSNINILDCCNNKKKMDVELSIYEILKIIGISVFDKTNMKELLTEQIEFTTQNPKYEQLKLWC